MKKITLLFAFLIASMGFSQTELLTNGDFENGKDSWGGSDFTVENGEAVFSSTNAAGNPWDTQLTQANMTFVNGAEYVLKFKARAAVDRKMTVAIQNVNEWSDQFRMEYDLTTTMTEYTATFNASKDFANVQIGFLMAGTGSTEAIYYDDVSITTNADTADPTCTDGIQNGDETGVDCGGSCNACPADPEPASASTAPPARNSWDVISLYGDSYGTAAGFNGVNWDNGADATEGTFAGENMLKITNGSGDFIGFDLANSDGFVDATDMTHIHADFWIAGSYVAGQVLKVKLSNHDDTEEINSITKEVVPGANDEESWVSIDVDMGADAREKIKQVLLIYTNSNGAPSVIYADNIYMYREATASVNNNELLGFSMYPNPASNRLHVSAKETIQNADIFNVLGKKVMSLDINKNSESIDVSNLTSGIYLVKYNVNGTTGTAKFVKQ